MRKVLLLLCISTQLFAQKQKVWLDADTGNEMDDVYAIVRLLWEAPSREIVGLSSAHFNNADLVAFDQWNQYTTAGINSVKISQALNEEILMTMGLSGIPHPMGADRQMGRAWGGSQPRPSAATDELQRVIRQLKPGEKLDILTLGAVTNVASLIAIDSTVKAKIRLYSLGLGYDAAKNVFNKNDFNTRCDLNGMDFLLDQTGLDWMIMPTATAEPYRFDRAETYARFSDERPVEQLMEARWRETNPGDEKRVLWDLALIQAYLFPHLAEVATVPGPPENTPQKRKIYAKINPTGMTDDFWNAVEKSRASFQQPTSKPKLGEIHLGNRVGGTIAQEGPTQQLICMEEGDQLTSLRTCLTRERNVVKAIRIEVMKKKGDVRTYVFGNPTGGVWQAVFNVRKGRALVGISGASGWFIDRIRFHFDDGSATPLYGGKGGDNDYQLILSRNEKNQLRGRWMGFWGSSTDLLESIGLVFWPIE